MYKIIGADQKEYGPVSVEQLHKWMSEGRINLQTKVCAEGTTDWIELGSLPEFAEVTPAAGPAVIAAPSTDQAAELVKAPATGLIVTAILGVFVQIVSLIAHFAFPSLMANSQMPKEAWANMFSGAAGVVFGVIAVLMAGLILFGALKMKKLESYGLAMAASIVAMIPCFSPCCLLGLPIGIWALVVLSKPEVKSAFH